jgi:hypothetical protein
MSLNKIIPMETKKEQTKDDLIRKLAEILDKHTKDESEVSMAITAMLEMKEFIFHFQAIRSEDLPFHFRNMRELIASSSKYKDEQLMLFDDIVDLYFEGIFLYINHPYGIETIAECGADPDLDKALCGK